MSGAQRARVPSASAPRPCQRHSCRARGGQLHSGSSTCHSWPSVTSRQGLHPKPSPEVGGPRGWRALLPPCGAGSSLSFSPAVPAKLTQKSQSLRSPAPQILGVRCLSLSDFCSGSHFLEDDHLQLTCGARVERTTFLPTPLRDCGFDSVLMGGSRVHFPQRVSH